MSRRVGGRPAMRGRERERESQGARRGSLGRLACLAGAAGLAVLVAACETPAGPAARQPYDFTLPTSPALVYRWSEGATIRVFVAGGESRARARILARALEAAAADWEAALEADVVRFAVVPSVDEADVVLRWSDVPAPVETAGCEPQLAGRATTTFCPTADGRALRRFPVADARAAEAGTVRMVVTVLAGEAMREARVRQLVAHELGHVLGIGRHSPSPEDLMWEGALTSSAPSEADRASIELLYRSVPDIQL